MKKIIFLLAISLFFFALAGHSQVRVGLAAGVSAAKMEGRIHGDRRAGLMTSMVLDASLGKNFSFYPSVSYVQKGVTEVHPDGTLIEKQYVGLRYAELTTNFVYHVGNIDGSNFFLGLGPSLDFNLPSKRTSITNGLKSSSDILFGAAPANDLRGVDYGVNIVLGWKTTGGFLISFNWNKGLRDLTPEGLVGETKNQYIGIQLGAFLNNGKK